VPTDRCRGRRRQRRRTVPLGEVPDIKARDFSGDLMHTAQWDATVDLTGKGWQSSARAPGCAVVPELASTAAQLTSSSARHRGCAQAGPPLPRRRACTLPSITRGPRFGALAPLKLQHDNTALTQTIRSWPRFRSCRRTFYSAMLRRRTARALTPRYPFRCKRVLLGESWNPLTPRR